MVQWINEMDGSYGHQIGWTLYIGCEQMKGIGMQQKVRGYLPQNMGLIEVIGEVVTSSNEFHHLNPTHGVTDK